MRRSRTLLASVAALGLLAAACGSDSTEPSATSGNPATSVGAGDLEDTLVVYSGRKLDLVEPIIERFEEATGVEVEIREGDSAEMAAQILEEGDGSPADVFFSQDAGALGALADEDRLVELDDEVLERVGAGVRSDDGRWVGVSGRVRVVVYNPDRVSEDELPDSILGFADEQWTGKVGWAPTNGSFQAFVTALRELEGEDVAEQWLRDIDEQGAIAFDGNSDIVAAVANGASSDPVVGFVNHYYLEQMKVDDPEISAANHFFTNGDVGGLVNVAGVGIIDTAEHTGAAAALVDFLLGEEAQQYFAEETFEVPLVDGVETSAGIPDLDAITVPEIDLNSLSDLQGTLALLTELGIV